MTVNETLGLRSTAAMSALDAHRRRRFLCAASHIKRSGVPNSAGFASVYQAYLWADSRSRSCETAEPTPSACLCRGKRALRLGVVSQKTSSVWSTRLWPAMVTKYVGLAAPPCVWRIVFSTHDIPKLRQTHWLPSFPHSGREIWVNQRQKR